LGEVTRQPISVSGLEGVSFPCDSPEHAVILLHKIASDLSQTAAVPVTWQTVSIGGVDGIRMHPLWDRAFNADGTQMGQHYPVGSLSA